MAGKAPTRASAAGSAGTDRAPTAAAVAHAAGQRQSLTPTAFSSTVTAITSAFGDPTRREIYLFVHEHDEGVTASQVAERFGLHSNVARHHLEKLAGGGYLEVASGRVAATGAGRPSKRYQTAAERVTLDVSVRTDDLVLTLLGRTLALLPPDQAQAMAEQVGMQYGQALAAGLRPADVTTGQRSLRAALHAVADALTAHGFAAHTEQRGKRLQIINNHCPFGDTAIEHPVICAVDRGLVKGMLSALYGDSEPETESSLPQGDTFCATAV